jgi:hypothetical protein
MKKIILLTVIFSIILLSGLVSAQKVKTFYDVMGKPVTTIDEEGVIRDAQGRETGRFTAKGEYLDIKGQKLGLIEKGVMYDKAGKEIAHLGEDGRVFTADGKYTGTIGDDGIVLNNHGIRLGTAPDVDKNLAFLIFFFPKTVPWAEKETPEKK